MLKTFFNNLRYFCRYNIKEIYSNAQEINNIHYCLDSIKYELCEDLNNIKKIKILNDFQTLEKLISSESSFARFGDGEINLIFGNGIPCQKYDDELSEKLRNTLISTDKKLMIGLPNLFASYEKSQLYVKNFSRKFYGKYTPLLLELLSEKEEYYSANSTYPYINSGKNVIDFEQYYNKFKSIWQDKNIAILCGDRVFKNIEYNIYDNAASIKYIYAPTNNAFESYEKILGQIKGIPINTIIILVLGPTATVLVYDLTKMGYRVLDLGHLGKDYDAYKKNIVSNKENAIKFFSPE